MVCPIFQSIDLIVFSVMSGMTLPLGITHLYLQAIILVLSHYLEETNVRVMMEQPFWFALTFNRQMALYLLLIAVMNFIYFMPTAV